MQLHWGSCGLKHSQGIVYALLVLHILFMRKNVYSDNSLSHIKIRKGKRQEEYKCGDVNILFLVSSVGEMPWWPIQSPNKEYYESSRFSGHTTFLSYLSVYLK